MRIKFINLCRITQKYTEEPGTPKTIDELFAEGNEEYVDIVSDTLNDNLYEKIIKKAIGNDYDMAKVCDAIWEITDDDMCNINNVRIFFFYNYANNSRTYCIESVKPKTIISVKDLINPSVEDLDKAFDTAVRGAKFNKEYVFNFNPSIQEARKELKDAVNKKLASDGIIQPVTQDTQSFIVDGGIHVEPSMHGTAREIVILNLTDNNLEEYTIRIKENQGNNNDTTLIENLNKGLYYDSPQSHEVKEYSQYIFKNQNLIQSDAVNY